MHGSARRLAAASLVLGLLLALPASAQQDRSFDVALLSPTIDAHGLLAVEGARTQKRWQVHVATLLGYAHAPLQLVLTHPDKSTSNHALIAGQLTLDLVLCLGLWDFLEVALVAPVAAQWYDSDAVGSPVNMVQGSPVLIPGGIYRGVPQQNIELSGAGPRDVRLAAKARLWHGEHFGIALLLAVTLPSGNAASFLGDRGATFRPLLAAEGVLRRWLLLLNLGAILRGQSDLSDFLLPQQGPPIFSVHHELTWAAGASYRFHRLAGASLEAFGTIPLAGVAPSAEADLLGALQVYPTSGVRLMAGVGGGLAYGTPRRDEVRAVLGISWSPAPGKGEAL